MTQGHNFKKIFFILFIAITGCSYNEPRQIRFNLEVYTQQIGNNTDKSFPEDFKILFTPFISKDCGDTLLFTAVNQEFGVTINRIDYNEKQELKFDLSSTLGKTVSNNPKRSEKIINSKFYEKKISKAFTLENTKADFQKNLKYSDRVVFMDDKYELDSVFVNGNYFKCFNNMESLKAFISEDLFLKYSQHKNISDFAIVYKVPTQPFVDSINTMNTANIEELTNAADKAMSNKNYSQAIELYNKILALQPENEKANQRLIVINQTIYPTEKVKSKSGVINTKSKSKIKVEFVPFYGLSIQEKLTKIADDKIDIEKRRIYKEITLEDFVSNNASVYVLTNDTNKLANSLTILDYLNNLYETHNYKVFVTEVQPAMNGKIKSLHLVETFK